ncbi:MAG: translation initiation factor IF-2 [Opitutae bacterium]|nr:translation initiation factor IF-2 [Opitutae bacterium]
MSVRIHQLSKQVGMENKELIELLRSRGFEVKSASSTVDNISAESLVEEFASTHKAEDTPADDAPVAAELPKGPVLPDGVVVKSAAEIKLEREAAAEAAKPKAPEAAASKPVAVAPKPAPMSKAPPSAPRAKGPPTALRPKSPPPGVAPAGLKSAEPAAPTGAKAPIVASPLTPEPKAPAAAKPVIAKAPAAKPAVAAAPKPPGPPKPPTVGAAKAESAPATTDAEASVDGDAEAEVVEVAERIIHAKPPIVVRDFATEIEVKPFKLISELMEMGIFASMNQTIEEPIAIQIAKRHGFKLEIHHRGETQAEVAEKKKVAKIADDDPRYLKPRPPVVCILGHVDHGKTTLLDTIRKANVTAGEAGGITQHIGAYQIEHKDQKITFLDTPGHAAFSLMRERGANVTDVAILVIAADDAFKPQTEEALRFAKEANNSIIVAINKVDAKGANVDRVKQQMQEKGIAPEDWGGETIAVEVSALKGTNIDDLLDMILLQTEVLELQANPDCSASGTIIEAQLEEGRGATASVIVERGTLKKGDALICGEAYCKVKSMEDENGKLLKEAPPSTPVKVIGWSQVPSGGNTFTSVKNEKTAKKAAAEATTERKREENVAPEQSAKKEGAVSIEDLFAAIAQQKKACLSVIVKSDVHGSTEALVNSIKQIESDKVDIRVISHGVGHISKNDIALASAGETNVTIVGFNVRLDNGVQSQAKHHDVRIIQHDIIYELLDQVEECMAELLEPELSEKKLGAAEIRQVFSMGKNRAVAGCMVTEGTINRNRKARLLRNGEVIHESKIDTLKRFKDDVKEVRAGFECGINVDGYDDYEEGDVIECFEVVEIRPTLR